MRTPLAWQLSAGEVAAVEEGLLLRRADAAEHRIAVREAAEAADDIGVPFRPFQAVGVIARAIERDRPFLISELLRMHEWQIEKAEQVGKRAVEAVEDGAAGDGMRQRVTREHARLPAEHVARELIEQDEQRQRTLRVRFPIGELAGGGGFMQLEEAPADVVIESGVLLEPCLLYTSPSPR